MIITWALSGRWLEERMTVNPLHWEIQLIDFATVLTQKAFISLRTHHDLFHFMFHCSCVSGIKKRCSNFHIFKCLKINSSKKKIKMGVILVLLYVHIIIEINCNNEVSEDYSSESPAEIKLKMYSSATAYISAL